MLATTVVDAAADRRETRATNAMPNTVTQHPFHAYLASQLLDRIHDRSVVVWYDEREEFLDFITELRGRSEITECFAETVALCDHNAQLICCNGSLFEAKIVSEPLVRGPSIEPLLVYVPGERELPKLNPLLEIELLGKKVDWKIAQMARYCLQKYLSDDQIDQVLRGEGNVAYSDIVRVIGKLDEPGAGTDGTRQSGSILHALFESARTAPEILASWLSSEDQDDKIEQKGAQGEIHRLAGKLGLAAEANVSLSDLRMNVARHVLVSEFVLDLEGQQPPSTAMVASAKTNEQQKMIRQTATALRSNHGDEYEEIADRVEVEFQLASANVPPGQLGSIDTFRFEERSLLGYAGALIVEGRFEAAEKLARTHERSFWAERDARRQQQWEACARMAVLGQLVESVRQSLPRSTDSPTTWIHRYVERDTGWCRVDTAYRQLQSHLASMTDVPESESAQHAVLNAYDDVLAKMTEGFVASLGAVSWQIPDDVLKQSEVFDELVAKQIGDEAPVGLVLADSLRYEMGIELATHFVDAKAIQVRAAAAAFPTITPIGMAALLPGASRSFDVVDAGGKVGVRIEDRLLTNLSERKRYLDGKIPGSKDITLDQLLAISDSQVKSRLHGCRLLVVRSQDIDEIGENMQAGLARQVMDTAVGNIARGIRKLSRNGVSRFFVVADHGHIFARRKDESMRIETPSADQIELHRRVWIGRGGATPGAAVRISAANMGYDSEIDFVVPAGTGVFKAGGGLAYHHGGLSLQELIVPVLAIELQPAAGGVEAGVEADVRDVPSTIRNRAFRITLTISAGGLFDSKQVSVRAALVDSGREIGTVGHVIDAEFDSASKSVTVDVGKTATLLMLLHCDDVSSASLVIEDASSKAQIYRSDKAIPVDVL